jgi:hypothetical protein
MLGLLREQVIAHYRLLEWGCRQVYCWGRGDGRKWAIGERWETREDRREGGCVSMGSREESAVGENTGNRAYGRPGGKQTTPIITLSPGNERAIGG